jgi:pilus assembly protein CpaB
LAGVSMSKRTIALVAAVVLAAVATFALISYVQGARDKVEEKENPVTVYVAKQLIPQGVSGDAAIKQALIAPETVPAKLRPDDAITSLDQIKGSVAAVNIQARETILASRFVAPGQVGAGLPIPENRVAMAIEVDVPPGVAGFVRQGDHVGVIGDLKVPATGGGSSSTATEQRTKFIVQNVEVLAVGQRVVTTADNGSQQASSQQTTNKVLITIAVTPAEAERLVFAVLEGKVYFTLVQRDFKGAKTPGRTARDALPK